jgi:multidrug efflux system outer membrane protein
MATWFPSHRFLRAGGASIRPSLSGTYTAGIGTTAYELDLFGRVRSLSNRAINQYLATEEGRKAAQTSLVAEVANAYLTYLADAELLRLTESTLKTRQKTPTSEPHGLHSSPA